MDHKMDLDQRSIMKCIMPLINYGIYESVEDGVRHGITEVALIAYLMGMGYDDDYARKIVESWEVDEKFPMTRKPRHGHRY